MDLMNNIYHHSTQKYIQQWKLQFTIAMSYSNSIHFPAINFLHPYRAIYCRMINETFHTLFYGTFHIFNIPLSTDFTESLRLTEVRIPNHVIRNNSVKLECHFDMNGEQLYSVKWYKDGYEFYRYVPRWVYTSATQNHMICGWSLDGKLSPLCLFRWTFNLFIISTTLNMNFHVIIHRDHPPAQVFDQNGINVDVSTKQRST